MNADICVLTGNGLSIAQYPDLSLDVLTASITTKFNTIGATGSDPARYLRTLAKGHKTGDPKRDFEALIGPLDEISDSLDTLGSLSETFAGAGNEYAEAAKKLRGFSLGVQRLGLSLVLDVIFANSRAADGHRDVAEALVAGLYDIAKPVGRITYGNLNYDSMIHAVLSSDLYRRDLCDMTDGRESTVIEIVPDHRVWAQPLREVANFPSRQQTLLQMHGSVAWLRSPDDGRVYRVTLDALRNADYFKALREGRTLWTPEVVLTSQSRKRAVVAQQPFALAYDTFADRLRKSDLWLVAGYSFRDDCVNDMLADALLARGRDVPKILIVTMGSEPTKSAIKSAFDVSSLPLGTPEFSRFTRIQRNGIIDAIGSDLWNRWSTGGLYAAVA